LNSDSEQEENGHPLPLRSLVYPSLEPTKEGLREMSKSAHDG